MMSDLFEGEPRDVALAPGAMLLGGFARRFEGPLVAALQRVLTTPSSRRWSCAVGPPRGIVGFARRAGSEQGAAAQPLHEVAPGKDENAILRATAGASRQTTIRCLIRGMVLSEGPEALQVVRRDFRGGPGLDREDHLVDDEVYLDAAGQAPVAERGEPLAVRVGGAQLMEDTWRMAGRRSRCSRNSSGFWTWRRYSSVFSRSTHQAFG